jgi:hypothetical protein
MQRSRTPWLIGVACALLGAMALVVWWNVRPRPGSDVAGEDGRTAVAPPKPPHPSDSDQFVGSAACTVCHAEIARRYEGHPMSQAAAVNRPDDTPQVSSQSPVHFQTGPFEYAVERADDTVVHREILRDGRHRVVVEQSVEVPYTLGSGVRGKSFLIDRGGRFYQSPISWYSQEGKWDLSPGYSLEISATRFERRVTDDCLSCHAGRMQVADADTPDVYRAPHFLEFGIGCERCHGPGRGHVELFEGGAVRPPGADLKIVNPGKLDAWQRDSVCFQCHLLARRVPRYGRRVFDFRPGQGLEEVLTVLVHPDDTSEGTPDKAVSHVQEMYASRCFQRSDGKFSCTSCHDPHGVPPADQGEKEAFFNRRCGECHGREGCAAPQPEQAAEPFQGSCVQCHMPRRTAGDIAHTSQTDHRVRRRPGPPPSDRPDESPLVFFAHMGEGLEPWEALRAQGLAAAEEAYTFIAQDPRKLLGTVDVLKQAHAAQPADHRVLQALGAVHYLAGRDAESRQWFERALPHAPRDEETLKMLGIACYRTGDFASGLKYLEQAIEVNPWNAEVYARYAVMAAVFEDLPTAIAAARKGLELAPALVPLRRDLVKFLEESGQTREATQERQRLIQIEAAAP